MERTHLNPRKTCTLYKTLGQTRPLALTNTHACYSGGKYVLLTGRSDGVVIPAHLRVPGLKLNTADLFQTSDVLNRTELKSMFPM